MQPSRRTTTSRSCRGWCCAVAAVTVARGSRARYPAVELLTALLFAAMGARFYDSWALPAYLVFTAGLVALSLIDLEHFVLPNRLLYPVGFLSIPLLLVGSVLEDDLGAFGRALLAGAVAFVVFYAIHVVSPRGMGFGDVRFSFLLGCFLGWLSWWHLGFGLFAGFLYGAVVGVALMALGKQGRRQHIPFGPFLAAGCAHDHPDRPAAHRRVSLNASTGRLRDSAFLGSASLLVLRVPAPPLRLLSTGRLRDSASLERRLRVIRGVGSATPSLRSVRTSAGRAAGRRAWAFTHSCPRSVQHPPIACRYQAGASIDDCWQRIVP